MTIATIHRVSVDFSYEVTDYVNLEANKANYQRRVAEATNGCLHSGSDSYTYTTEWAEFDTMTAAIECDKRLHKLRRDLEMEIANQPKEKGE